MRLLWIALGVIFLPCGLTSPVATRNVIPECSHLTVVDEKQTNNFEGKHGQTCCMCPKGTYFAGECNINFPNSTICKDCQYDDAKRSYVDFEPHMQIKCTDETIGECPGNKVKVSGSRFFSAKCVCPSGTIAVDHGFRCEPVPDIGSNPLTVNLPSTNGEPQHIHTSTRPTLAETAGGTTTSSRDVEEPRFGPHIGGEDGDIGSTTQKTPMTSNSRGTPKTLLALSTESSAIGATTISNQSTSAFNVPWKPIFTGMIVICIVLLVGLSFLCCWWWLCRQSSHTIVLHDCEEITEEKEKPVDRQEVVRFRDILDEESQPLNAAQPMREIKQSGDQQIEETIRNEPPKVEPPHICYKACMKMAEVIDREDLCKVGRELLPKEGREFEDIFDQMQNIGRAEVARRVFLRALQLRQDLTLEDIRNVVADLGYLCNIVDEEIKLRAAVDYLNYTTGRMESI